MAIYKMKCKCGSYIQGYNDCYWDGRLKARFKCYECGSVYEYVDVERVDIVKIKE